MGGVGVVGQVQQFDVKLEVFPIELEGGGTVYFTVKGWNFENSAIPLNGFVEDENGAIVKRIEGFEGKLPANAQNYTLTAFNLQVDGVGNHTFKLFLDNTDGKPNGIGEEHWSEVRVEVRPNKLAYATLDCPRRVPQNDEKPVQCKIKVWNTGDGVFSTKITKVIFGNNVIWEGADTTAAEIDQLLITVPAHGVNNVSLTLSMNGLAKLLYGDTFFNYKLPEYSPYLVKVYFTNLPPASDIIEITEANSFLQTVYNYGTAAISGAGIGAAVAFFGGGSILVGAAGGGASGVAGQALVDSGSLNWFKLLIEVIYTSLKHKEGIIPDSSYDGNDVTGG